MTRLVCEVSTVFPLICASEKKDWSASESPCCGHVSERPRTYTSVYALQLIELPIESTTPERGAMLFKRHPFLRLASLSSLFFIVVQQSTNIINSICLCSRLTRETRALVSQGPPDATPYCSICEGSDCWHRLNAVICSIRNGCQPDAETPI